MEGLINSQIIPAWLVAFCLITTGLTWIMSYKRKVRLDFKLFALTYILQGILFFVIFQLLKTGIEVRGFVSRLLIVMLCLSQSIPLTISYIRSFNRDTK